MEYYCISMVLYKSINTYNHLLNTTKKKTCTCTARNVQEIPLYHGRNTFKIFNLIVAIDDVQ